MMDVELKNMKKIKHWKKIGEFKDIFRSKYGQFIGQQIFSHPETGKEEEYIFHGESDGVRVFALTSDKNVIAIREYQHAVDEVILQLPTGGIKKGESHEEAATRELLEETGYKAERLISLGESYSLPRSSPTREYSFLALGCEQVKDQNLDSNEQIEIVETPLLEWIELVQKGEIKQDVSVVATMRALPHLGLSILPGQKSH